MDKKAFLVTKVWVYFGYNYSDPKEFVKYICEKCDKMYIYKHTLAKFDHIYDVYGAHAVMNRFYADLDADLRDALVEYAIKFYAPTAFHWTDEEKEILGINK